MTADIRLDGKVALVTGASRGIGRFLAQRLASAGATVVVAARSLDESVAKERKKSDKVMPGTLRETVSIIESAGGRAIPIAVDLLNPEQRDSCVARAVEAAGGLDILINNAGFCYFSPIETMSDETFDITYQQYMRVPFILSKAAIPHMKARGAGWIVNISSATANKPRRPFGSLMSAFGDTVYAAMKAGLNRFTQGLAEELVGYNIAVNAVGPTMAVVTPGSAEFLDDRAAKEDPAYIAAAVLDMCYLPAAERTGLIAHSVHYTHAENVRVMSLDGKTQLPNIAPSPNSNPNIPAAGSGKAY